MITTRQTDAALPAEADPPVLVSLDDAVATDQALTGSKAACLAKATAAGLPVLPGIVATTAVDDPADIEIPLRTAWERLSGRGATKLAVRSSSTAEDLSDSSMAGRFVSVTGVADWERLVSAVEEVLESSRLPDMPQKPMAVLLQPMVSARCGGVMFGIDPVTGREDRIVISVVAGTPEKLVSGQAAATTYEVDRGGNVKDREDGADGDRLKRRQIKELVALARRVRSLFGSDQDVEWAIDHDGKLWLLQSRPITTARRGVPSGPVFTPGPVAETFPDPLSRLEEDLWVPPLREAMKHALTLVATAPTAHVEGSDVVICVGGRLASDADLLGLVASKNGFASKLNPIPKVRRLAASWRVGRLRAALPALARDVIEDADAALAEVPPLDNLTTRQCVELLNRAQDALKVLQAYEMLLGLALEPEHSTTTAASVALTVLRARRHEGESDAEIIERDPIVLALAPPKVGVPLDLPDVGEASDGVVDAHDPAETSADPALLREALRIRARWYHELTARAAAHIGQQLAATSVVQAAADVRDLSLEDLRACVLQQRRPERAEREILDEPLPSLFQMSDRGAPIPWRGQRTGDSGVGVGGGSVRARVSTPDGDDVEGTILVVGDLDPALAPRLAAVAGVVAETGSTLSHLAILAREQGVPMAVAVPDARQRFPAGAVIELDGTSGDVKIVEDR